MTGAQPQAGHLLGCRDLKWNAHPDRTISVVHGRAHISGKQSLIREGFARTRTGHS